MADITPDYTKYYSTLQAHYDAGRWSGYLFMCANSDRAPKLLEIIQKTRAPSRLWPLVNEVWTLSNNIAADQYIWDDIWKYAYSASGRLRQRRGLMRPCDRKVFDNLPEQVTAYRGCHHAHWADGYSWTLDRSVAESFARRASYDAGCPLVATATIPHECILAYFNEREEQEVVVNRHSFDWYGDEIKIDLLELEQEFAA